MAKVLNKYKDKITCNAVYIGRGCMWGNPFPIGSRHGTRKQVIEKYIKYYYDMKLYRYIEELRGKDLVCFCAPLPCHGDFLLKQANKFRFKLARGYNGR